MNNYFYPSMPDEFYRLNKGECPIKLPQPSPEQFNLEQFSRVQNWIKDPCWDLDNTEEEKQFAKDYDKAVVAIKNWKMKDRIRCIGLWIASISLWVDHYKDQVEGSSRDTDFFDL